MKIACGFLNEDGTRCENGAMGFAIIHSACKVPCCDVHAVGPYGVEVPMNMQESE